MSITFSLMCKKTKKRLWIGQGHHKPSMMVGDGQVTWQTPHIPVMEALYSNDEALSKLRRFLQAHIGMNIQFVCDEYQDENPEFYEYEEFK